MRFILGLIAVLAIVGIAGLYTGYIDLGMKPGTMPSVEVKGGSLPTFNASVAKVEVGTRNETVEVPTVDIKKPQ